MLFPCSGIGKENTAAEHIKNGNKPTSGIPGSNNLGSGGKIPRFTKSDHDALAEIFKKIGQQELTKQGLQELYNFKQQNPHADLEPFLNKSSSYFRQVYLGDIHNSTAGHKILKSPGKKNLLKSNKSKKFMKLHF